MAITITSPVPGVPAGIRPAPGAAYLEHFAATRARLDRDSPEWLRDLRRAAADSFRSSGFPTIRREPWRFTNVAALIDAGFDPEAEPAPFDASRINGLVFGREAVHRLVFVNGRLHAELSTPGILPAGVTLMGFADALARRPDLVQPHIARAPGIAGHEFAALNAAFAGDGYVLHLASGVKADAPIEILWVGSGAERPPAYHTRNLIVAGKGAHATVIEHHVGLCIGSYFADSVTEIALGEDALLRHCKVQDESREAYHIALTGARLAAGAHFDSFVFSIGARLARNEIHAVLDGKRAQCRMNGGYLGTADQHLDHTTVVDHAHRETTSRELYKGVLDGRARGVFQGKITVHRDAQKSDGQQLNRALLLSPKAEIDSKPELEIYADDVKCSHGATAGDLDENAMFYLRSRGIPAEEARRLLVEAFLAEVMDSVALAGMRLSLDRNIARWMGRN